MKEHVAADEAAVKLFHISKRSLVKAKQISRIMNHESSATLSVVAAMLQKRLKLWSHRHSKIGKRLTVGNTLLNIFKNRSTTQIFFH